MSLLSDRMERQEITERIRFAEGSAQAARERGDAEGVRFWTASAADWRGWLNAMADRSVK